MVLAYNRKSPSKHLGPRLCRGLDVIQHQGPTSLGISGVNEVVLQINPSFMLATNHSHASHHLDYAGDIIMDLTAVLDISYGNTTAYGGSTTPYSTPWQESGSNVLSSMQEIYCGGREGVYLSS